MKYLLSVLILTISSGAYSQRNYMSLSFGTCIPKGQYASSENLNSDGFAVKGFLGDYSGAYYFNRTFGITGNLLLGNNLIDVNAAKEKLEDLIPPDFPPEDAEINFQLGAWFNINFMAGPQLTFPLGDKLLLDAYATGGMSVIIPPKMEITAVVDAESYHRIISKYDFSLSYAFGGNLRYNLNSQYGIKFGVGYFESSIDTKVKQEIENLLNTVESESDYTLSVKSMNIGIGIIYRL